MIKKFSKQFFLVCCGFFFVACSEVNTISDTSKTGNGEANVSLLTLQDMVGTWTATVSLSGTSTDMGAYTGTMVTDESFAVDGSFLRVNKSDIKSEKLGDSTFFTCQRGSVAIDRSIETLVISEECFFNSSTLDLSKANWTVYGSIDVFPIALINNTYYDNRFARQNSGTGLLGTWKEEMQYQSTSGKKNWFKNIIVITDNSLNALSYSDSDGTFSGAPESEAYTYTNVNGVLTLTPTTEKAKTSITAVVISGDSLCFGEGKERKKNQPTR